MIYNAHQKKILNWILFRAKFPKSPQKKVYCSITLNIYGNNISYTFWILSALDCNGDFICIVRQNNNVKYKFYSVIKNLEWIFWSFFAAIIDLKSKPFDKNFFCLYIFVCFFSVLTLQNFEQLLRACSKSVKHGNMKN